MEKIVYKVEALVEEFFFYHDNERRWVDISGFIDNKEDAEKVFENCKSNNKEWENQQDFEVIRYEIVTYKVTEHQLENGIERIYEQIS